MSLYVLVAFMDLVVKPGGIQHITPTRLLTHSSHQDTSSASDLEKPDRDIMSSSEPSFLVFPKKTMSGELGQDRPQLSESLEDDSVLDADSPWIELSRLGTLDSKRLDCPLVSLE